MENAIVIINKGDIPAAVQVARDLPSFVVYVFDPVLVDSAVSEGFGHVELISWDNCPSYRELDAAARADAFTFESELDLIMQEVLPGVSIRSWQHLSLYYLFMALKWYSGLWDELSARLIGVRPHIFICDNPAEYYFNSFIPPVLLLWNLKKQGIDFSAYSYGHKADTTDLLPDFSGVGLDAPLDRVLTHLPACMYDFSYFDAEIRATGKTLVNIEARYFNFPLRAHTTVGLIKAERILETFSDQQRESVNVFSMRLSEELERLLAPLIVIPSYRERQSRCIGNSYRSQFMLYLQLNNHFERSKPSRILLSDHDAGFHGPLVSFAKKHFLPVSLLPHAKTSANIEFDYGGISALTHPVQGREIFDASGRCVFNQQLCYPENFLGTSTFSGELKTISLLLNAFSLNGIYFSRYAEYFWGIKKIADWCRKNRVELRVRCKPSYSIINLLARDLGLDMNMLLECARETMDEHVRKCDLCLMFDTPTSASLFFLGNSVPILNCVVDSLSPAELTMVNPNVVPQERVDASLQRVQGFVSDPLSYFAFRNAQFRDYVQLFQQARPLRSCL